ncbi:MAG: indolepyruvate oxidoreductase subunit beta [bacterium]|nr:indolepyruvate oxidoreductase subunit beta [bacterium]MDT8396746.1 indolepyruvate oxidoreductase subunit beta [bacterium]
MIGGSDRPANILMVGVGGQGTILASELMSRVLLEAGYEVKKSEVHGMAQRGGRVVSHVRFGEKVYSPLIAKGEADILVGFEMAETLRSLDWMIHGARVLADNRAILSYTSQVGQEPYPFDALDRIRSAGFQLDVVEGEALAAKAGEKKTANVVLMGLLARYLPVQREVWEETIRRNMPAKFVDVNLKAFSLGWEQISPEAILLR